MNKPREVVQAGRTHWMVAGGFVPVRGTGPEPGLMSHDVVAVLNTSNEAASLAMHFYFADAEPVGPFELAVDARRVLRFRINNLIDPQALPLGVPYAFSVDASQPVVVQLTRQDTRQRENAIMGAIAFPVDEDSTRTRG